MTSLLAGSLARTVGKALSGIFLPSTFTQAGVAYPCKAIFETQGRYPGPAGVTTAIDATVLVLSSTLSVQPRAGDQISLSGSQLVVLSNNANKNAVITDPAGAVWTLLCKRVPLQSGAYAGYAAVAVAMGSPFDVYRPSGPMDPLQFTNKYGTLNAIFTDAKAQGFSFTKAAGYDDVQWNALIDGSQLQVGDFFVGGFTYFVAALDPLLPISCVRCNRTVTLARPNSQMSTGGGQSGGQPSQAGGTGTYWGTSATEVQTTTDLGRDTLAENVPCAMLATAGRATGTGELVSDAPGPARWRVFLPVSCMPKGSVQDRDILIDEEGSWYQVSAAGWTALGYRCECIRLEN